MKKNRLKKNPAYKPSGVEWLGDVPEHWEVKGLRYVCRFTYGDSLAAEDRQDGDFSVYGSNGQVGTHVIANTKKPVIVVGRKGSFGKINYSDEPVFAIDTTYFIDSDSTNNNLEWLKYSLSALQLDGNSKDSAVPGLAREDAYANRLSLPPLAEQTAIAGFLDGATGRIDALVDKKKRLVALLREKRTAMISRAVTQGLDPTAKRKPSAVEWLGDIPEHWEVLPLKRIVEIPITDGPHETPEILDSGIPFISAEAIRDNHIDFNRKRGYISIEDHRHYSLKYKPQKNDVFMIKSGATTGNLAIVETDDDFNIWSPLAVIRADANKALPRYVLLAMNSKEFQISVQLFWSYGTQQNIGMNVIENLPVPLPPLSEQQAIADYLDKETGKIDALIVKVEAAIDKLNEYRTAIISAAVTGKIMVRGTE